LKATRTVVQILACAYVLHSTETASTNRHLEFRIYTYFKNDGIRVKSHQEY